MDMEIEVLENIPIETKKITVAPDSVLHIGQKEFNILLLNIRGIKTNLDKFMVFLESCNLKCCDIIILTECHSLESVSLFGIPGFNVYYDHANFNTFDGVLVYTKCFLDSITKTKTLNTCNISITNLACHIGGTALSLNICYRSPNSNTVAFLRDLNEYLLNTKKTDLTLFMGDINLNILNTNDNLVNEYISVMNTHGFFSLYEDVTRPESQTCLDHVFLKTNLKESSIKLRPYIVDYDITDHLPVLVEFSLNNENCDNENQKQFTVKNINYKKLTDLAQSKNWEETLTYTDSEMALDYLIKNIADIVEESYEEKVINKKFRKLKPWISNGLIISIKERDRLKHNLKKNPTLQNITEFKNYRNKLNKLITLTKNNYYKAKIDENNKNIKKIYNFINEAVNENKKDTNNDIKVVELENGKKTVDQQDIADNFNDYFINVGLKMAETIKAPSTPIELTNPSLNYIYVLKTCNTK